MPLPRLNLFVPQEGFEIQDGEYVLRARLGAGLSRQRLDMLGAPFAASVQLVLSSSEYQYWRAFFRSQIGSGALPFLIDLPSENAATVEHEAKIVPGSVSANVRGFAYVVSMQLEVKRPLADAIFDAMIIESFALYGDQGGQTYDQLAFLTNEQFGEFFA